MVNLKINGINVSVESGSTILDAAKKVNIDIPTLCYHEDLCIAGNCRVCVVEQKGMNALKAACATPAENNMEIFTNTLKVREARKTIIALLLAEHNNDCLHCYKNGNCELQNLAKTYLVEPDTFINIVDDFAIDRSSPSIIKDDSKCIKCQRCVRTCAELQDVNALCVANKGSEIKISTFLEKPMADVVCTNCGQCVTHCPTGA
ncbi:MAG: 2Fe-2S iron-sulfur cluster-binding protein, partial [Actinomycetota bacterium]|nr:2Fe-2S iron-sulfur cluster-binding protein [Actinomycetota bacterium]